MLRNMTCHSRMRDDNMEFPNAVVRRNMHMSTKEHKCPQKSAIACPQKNVKRQQGTKEYLNQRGT